MGALFLVFEFDKWCCLCSELMSSTWSNPALSTYFWSWRGLRKRCCAFLIESCSLFTASLLRIIWLINCRLCCQVRKILKLGARQSGMHYFLEWTFHFCWRSKFHPSYDFTGCIRPSTLDRTEAFSGSHFWSSKPFWRCLESQGLERSCCSVSSRWSPSGPHSWWTLPGQAATLMSLALSPWCLALSSTPKPGAIKLGQILCIYRLRGIHKCQYCSCPGSKEKQFASLG